jgi:hypothetical protein
LYLRYRPRRTRVNGEHQPADLTHELTAVLMQILARYKTLKEDVMKGTIVVVGVVAALVVVRSSEAQVIKNGALSGVIVSKSIAVPASSSAPVFTTPAAGKGVFVLTQFCRSNCPELSGSTLARIGDNGSGCTTYSPGIALPPGETLTCTSSGCDPGAPCTITGVVTKK